MGALMREVEALDGVAYADVILTGSTVRINIVEELPRVNIIDVSSGLTVTSGYDAVVTRQIVYSGTAVKHSGDIVKAGETLIDGTIAVGEETVEIAARGEVYGLVVYKSSIYFNGTISERVRSGNSYTETVVSFLGLDGREKGAPYKTYETQRIYETSGFLFPMKTTKLTYFEIIERETVMTISEAEQVLSVKALASASNAVPDGAVIINKQTTVRQVGEGYIIEGAITVEQRIDSATT